MDELNLNSVDAGTVEVVTPQQDEQVETTESVNTEVAPVQEDKPVQSAEENAKYAAIRREAEQKATQKAQDDLIASMYGESHGIYTKADYDKAVEAEREQERLKQIAEEKNIPEDVAMELLEAKKLKEQMAQERSTREQQQQQEKNMMDFIDAFPDVKAESIPVEVWEKVGQGVPLKYAYIEHQYKMIREGQATQKKNLENAEVSTGSVKGKLDIGNDHITADIFETNKNDANWVKKNFTKIMESRAKW